LPIRVALDAQRRKILIFCCGRRHGALRGESAGKIA
jgi:hypothetical protein